MNWLGRAVVLLAAALAVTSCTPRDPLDWKIDGRNAEEIQSWIDHQLEKMPAPLADELAVALVRIRNATHGWNKADPLATNNPLSLRLHGRTVRDVLLEGLRLEADDYAARAKNDKDNILRFLKNVEDIDLDAPQHERLRRQLDRLQRQSEINVRAYEALEKRIGQLLAQSGS